MNKFFRNVGFYLLIIIIAISIIDYYSSKTTTKTEVSYTAFLKQVEDQKVERVTIVDNTIRGKMKEDTRQDKIITTVWGVGYKIEK